MAQAQIVDYSGNSIEIVNKFNDLDRINVRLIAMDRFRYNHIHPIHEDYYRKLKDINEGDLKFVEKDLALYEKVSLAFLLFGNNKVNSQYALQRLLVLVNNQSDDSDLLREYAKLNTDWRKPLLEALSIIRANKVIRKLGFAADDLRVVFLPHIPETSLYIHPVLKALYVICERLTNVEAGRLVLEINNQANSANYIRFYDPNLLEIYLLDWITKDVISIGQWPDFSNKPIPKLDPIVQYLKLNEKELLKEILLNVARNLYKTVKYDTKATVRRPNLNENDSGASRNEEFEKKASLDLCQDDRYLIRKEWAGFLLTINQKDFERESNPSLQDQLPQEPLKPRRGTDVDKAKLKSTFSMFGYKPLEFDGCNHLEMLNIIKDTVERSIVYDSLIVCILSHGIEGAVYGKNSIPVSIKSIQKLMASDSLLGKPKMLIIQACQGANYQKARKLEYLEHDAPEPSASAYSDMLTAVATVPGFASVRHIERGTWFIQTLCKLIDQLGDRKHMLDILTAVNKEVTAMRGNENQCMVPLSSQTLNKSFFLPKRF